MRKTTSACEAHRDTLTTAFDDYLLACGQHSAGTQRWYAKKLTTFLRWCDGHELRHLDM